MFLLAMEILQSRIRITNLIMVAASYHYFFNDTFDNNRPGIMKHGDISCLHRLVIHLHILTSKQSTYNKALELGSSH